MGGQGWDGNTRCIRLLVETKQQALDLAGNPWRDHEVTRFRRLRVSHPDWSPLMAEENKQLEKLSLPASERDDLVLNLCRK